MAEKFIVKLNEEHSVQGHAWEATKPVANLVMITGMQEYSFRYDRLAKYLNEKGINVYCLDHFGQGLNAKSVEEQQQWPVDAFKMIVDAIHAKVEEVKKSTSLPTYVFGHSMGSFAIQSYLERYPETADKAIICGSNGPALGLYKMGFFLASIIVNKKNWNKEAKFLTNMGMGAYKKSVKDRKTDLDWLSVNEENVKTYIDDPYCGHPNTQGFWKEFLRGMSHLYEKKSTKCISPKEHVLIIAGDSDPVGGNGKGPTALYKLYKSKNMEDVTLIIYPNMRHEIHNETEYMKVYEDISNFLLK
ncbi:MAG: alpha/beta hydrolase [Bacilli bacterium]|nr:alpha/beta hydrolase [Bacilli bacterium]